MCQILLFRVHRRSWQSQRRTVALTSPESNMAARNATRPFDLNLSSIAPVDGFPIKVLPSGCCYVSGCMLRLFRCAFERSRRGKAYATLTML